MFIARHHKLTLGQVSCVLVLLVLSIFCQTNSVSAYEGKPILLPPMQATFDLTKSNSSQTSLNEEEYRKTNRVETVQSEDQKLAIEYLKHGAKLHQKGHSLIAESFFNKAVKLDPQNSDAYFNLGALYEAKGDFLTAKSHYKRGLLVSPGDAELLSAFRFVDRRLSNSNNFDALSAVQRNNPGLNSGLKTSQTSTIPFNLKSSMHNAGVNTQAPPVVSVGQRMPVVKKSFMGPKTKAVLGALIRTGISIGIRAAIGGGGCNSGFRF